VIVFIVSAAARVHTFSMSQSPEDDLLPWVVGGVLLITMTIAVAAASGSDSDQLPAAVQGSEQLAQVPLSDPTRVVAPANTPISPHNNK
jgi:hypothetical protein